MRPRRDPGPAGGAPFRRRLAAVAAWAGIGAVAFGLLHGLRAPLSIRTVGLAALMGVVVGALAAPELEPKLFRRPGVWQTLVGAAGGALLALSFAGTIQALVAGAIVGGVLGAFANLWVRYV